MRSGKKFTIGFLPTLLALVAMLVAGCGGNGGTGGAKTKAPTSQQNFRVALAVSDISTFDPAITTDAESAMPIEAVFTGLISLNDQLQVQDQLAASHSVSSDGLTYTFHMRTGQKFSDGTPLDANDVAYSIDRALSKDVSAKNGVTGTYLGLIKDSDKRMAGKIATLIGDSIKVIDPNTISLTISQQAPYFLEALSYPTSFVVEKSVVTQWGDKWTDHLGDNGGQGGNGPFVVQTYSHTTGITLIPNPHYYGKAPALAKLNFLFFKEGATAYSAFQAKQIDWDRHVPAADIPTAQKDVKEYVKSPLLAIQYITMNMLYKPFDNIKIRQAFELAINKDVIVHSIYHDAGIPTCHMVPQGMPGYDTNLQCPGGAPTKGDAAKAKQLLAAGMQEEGVTTLPPITLTYYSGSASLADTITTVRQMWQQVLGVNVQTNVVDFNTILTQSTNSTCTSADLKSCVNKGLQMWTLGWIADYPDPQDWTSLQVAKGSASNNWNYGQNLSANAAQQAQTQDLLAKADSDLGADRLSLYNQAEQQMVNDVVWLSLYQENASYLLRSTMVGVPAENAQGLIPPDDWGGVYVATN